MKGRADKTGKGTLDNSQFVEMACSRQDVGVSHSKETATVAKAAKPSRNSAERMRQRRAAWTDEERAAYRKKEAERKRKKRAEMSEEEREIVRKREVEYKRRRRTVMTLEKMEAPKAEGNERRVGMTPNKMDEFRARKALRARKRKQNMSEEEKAEMSQRIVINRLMKRATMTEEEEEKHRYKKRMRFYARQAKMTKEEREQDARRRLQVQRKWREGLTGEKLERYKESIRRAMKKCVMRNPEKVKVNYLRRIKEETPQQRWKRLRSYRICQAKRLLRRKLERDGLAQEEIDEKVKDLVKRMKEEPMPQPEVISAYKPRPRKNCKEPDNSEPDTSTVRVTRSKNSSSNDSSLFSDMKTIEAEPIVEHVQFVKFSTVYLVEHKIIKYEDGADFADVFNDCDIQSDPLKNDEEESDIKEGSHSPIASLPMSPVMTSITSTNSFLAPSPPMIKLQLAAASPQPCPHCSEAFNEENLLKDHLRSSHLHKCFKCPKCKEIVFSPKELSDHFKTHQTQPQKEEKPSPFTCIKCTSVGFQSQEKLSEHVRHSHPGSFFPCQYCKVVIYSKSSLATHLKFCKMASLVCVNPRQARKCTDW